MLIEAHVLLRFRYPGSLIRYPGSLKGGVNELKYRRESDGIGF
jgi:hypothetical protein